MCPAGGLVRLHSPVAKRGHKAQKGLQLGSHKRPRGRHAWEKPPPGRRKSPGVVSDVMSKARPLRELPDMESMVTMLHEWHQGDLRKLGRLLPTIPRNMLSWKTPSGEKRNCSERVLIRLVAEALWALGPVAMCHKKCVNFV